jgi:hypothetical protein
VLEEKKREKYIEPLKFELKMQVSRRSPVHSPMKQSPSSSPLPPRSLGSVRKQLDRQQSGHGYTHTHISHHTPISSSGDETLCQIRVVARIRPMSNDETKRGCKRSIQVLSRSNAQQSLVETHDNHHEPESIVEVENLLGSSFESSTLNHQYSDDRINDKGMNQINSNDNNQLPTPSVNNRSHQTTTSSTTITAESGTKTHAFQFDHVIDGVDDTVYEQVMGSYNLQRLFQGYNVTILCYGQTASGKTYTMESLLPRVVQELFDAKQRHEHHSTSTVTTTSLELSCLELYQDDLRDTLSSGSSSLEHSSLSFRDVGVGVAMRDRTWMRVNDSDEMLAWLEQAAARRTTATTANNERSSRSHALTTIVVTTEQPATTAQLTLVDLAGSERWQEGRQQETIHINKDLFVLRKVVSALARNNGGHIPYRDSILTRLLRDSFGGTLS